MISIVTINLNNKDGLLKTIKSMEEQSINKDKVNFIVIDGGSTDGSLSLIKNAHANSIIQTYISEKDNGIYDAMNKGLSVVEDGEYVIFMNSGDTFHNHNTLSNAFDYMVQDGCNSTVYYGDKIDSDGKLKKAYTVDSLKMGIINACHQSYFYKKNKRIKYDEEYKLFSDLDFTVQYYLDNNHFKYMPFPISVYEGGGVSMIHQWKTKREIYRIVYRRFGVVLFMNFLKIKLLSILGIPHTRFLKESEI